MLESTIGLEVTMPRLLIAVSLAVTLFGSAAQDIPMKPDGRMWAAYGNASSQGTFIKAAYVQGVLAGMDVGATLGYLQGRTDEGNDFLDYVKQCAAENGRACPDIPERKTKPETLMRESMAGADKVREKLAPQNGTSVLDVVRQVDKFYSDYRNTPVCMIQAVQESIQSLKGAASTEQGLAMLRKGCDSK